MSSTDQVKPDHAENRPRIVFDAVMLFSLCCCFVFLFQNQLPSQVYKNTQLIWQWVVSPAVGLWVVFVFNAAPTDSTDSPAPTQLKPWQKLLFYPLIAVFGCVALALFAVILFGIGQLFSIFLIISSVCWAFEKIVHFKDWFLRLSRTEAAILISIPIAFLFIFCPLTLNRSSWGIERAENAETYSQREPRTATKNAPTSNPEQRTNSAKTSVAETVAPGKLGHPVELIGDDSQSKVELIADNTVSKVAESKPATTSKTVELIADPGQSSLKATTDHFSIGSTQQEVLSVQGTPSGVHHNLWSYDYSTVTFTDGLVTGYSNRSGNLKVLLLMNPNSIAAKRGSFFVGSDKQEVLDVQGTPSGIRSNTWWYGYSSVKFKNGVVSEYSNISHNLKIRP